MPYINISGKNIFYKEYGNGEPIVFLNGVMMSTNSWSLFIRIISRDFKMIAVDLLDQGRSDSCENGYTIDKQVQILKDFLKELKIKKVHLVGMSYGGKVAQSFTIKYPTKVRSLILSNTDSYTTNNIKKIAKEWDCAASTLDETMFYNAIMPYLYSCDYYKRNYIEMKKKEKVLSKVIDREWYLRFKRTLNSIINYNISDQIKNIKVPTLIISSEFDAITPIKYQQFIHEEIENSKWVIIKDSGHASMYEKPEEFISIIMEFLDGLYKR
ncbi:MAG: alpha/beta hydrolase [Tissierellia bacterium]|nr:alpha/beta hydrolase [Tissierellia bacterium]